MDIDNIEGSKGLKVSGRKKELARTLQMTVFSLFVC